MCISTWLPRQTLLCQVLAVFCMCASSVVAQSPTQTSLAPSWPTGTEAQGSSVHDQLDDGTRFYDSYAIDGNPSTKWNDDTVGAYPDTLTLSIPIAVTLTGIVILSSEDGWLLAYTVETNNGSDWTTAAEVRNATSAVQLINFLSPVIARKLRINVTQDQPGYNTGGEYTRIHEVYPLFGISPSSTSSTSSAPSASGALSASNISSTSTTDKSTSKKCSSTGAIAGGIIGGVAAIILAALALYFVLRKRRSEGRSELSETTSNINPTLTASNQYPARYIQEAAGDTGHAPYSELSTEIGSHGSPIFRTVDLTNAKQVNEMPAELQSRTGQNIGTLSPTTMQQVHRGT